MARISISLILVSLISPWTLGDVADKPNPVTKRPEIVRLISAKKDKQLRAQLPRVEDEDIQKIFDDPSLIFYSDREIPPAYQDWSSGLQGVHSPSYNISSNRSEPFGNGNVEFPWGAPGGTHRTKNVSTFRFLWLPKDESGKKRPIVWYRKFLSRSSREGYAWTFPVGTVVGEVLQLQSPSQAKITFEVRVRIREYGEWAVDVFRPFPTHNDLTAAIKERRPAWQDDETLSKLVNHLEQSTELKSFTLTDNHPGRVFRRSMGVDSLPEIGDDELTTELLTKTTFRSALGESWRTGSNGIVAAAPTTRAAFHIVPARYDAGFIEVDRSSCMNCHETVNKNVNDFEFGRDWYGRIRGSDGIFSLHPFDPSSISHNGSSRPVRMNRTLVVAGLFEEFDGHKHSSDHYQRLQDVEE